MSKNRNRAKLNKAQNSREYKILTSLIFYPPYDELGWSWNHGNLSNHKWRSYRTWKYNRLDQHKN